MADETQKQTVTLEELVVSNLAMADALAKLLIAKGVFTDEEFKTQLGAERGELSRCVEALALNWDYQNSNMDCRLKNCAFLT